MSMNYSSLPPKNTINDFPKTLETSHDKVIHTNSNLNTYTNVDFWKNSKKCLAPNPNIPKKNFNQFHTFLRTSAPFNYYPEKNGYVVYYNGGLVKEFKPLVSRQDLAKYLRTNGSLVKPKKRCLSSYKNNNFCSRGYRTNCMCNCMRRNQNKEQIYQNEYPYLGNTPVNRKIFSSSSSFVPKNKGKIIYKLRNNNRTFNCADENCYKNDYMQNNYNSEINNRYMDNYNDFGDEMNDKREQLNNNMREVNDNDGTVMSKRDQILNCFTSSSYTIKPKIGRRFHKVQIFNNYKPFLVDDFKEYAAYE